MPCICQGISRSTRSARSPIAAWRSVPVQPAGMCRPSVGAAGCGCGWCVWGVTGTRGPTVTRRCGATTTAGRHRRCRSIWRRSHRGWQPPPGCGCHRTSASSTTTVPTARWGLHQDKDERPETLEAGVPIVSVSLGDTAKFILGGFTRKEPKTMVPLASGDGFVFGGRSRMRYHGVAALLPGTGPPELGLDGRFNLTFRQGAEER